MGGDEDGGRETECVEPPAAIPGHLDGGTEEPVGGDRAEADEHVRLDDRELGGEPWPARRQVLRGGPLMDAALPRAL